VTESQPSTVEPGGRRTIEIVVSVPTVVKAVGIFFALILAYLVRDALLSIALAAVLVLGLDPPVSALERRGWGRGKAALMLFATIGLVLAVIVWAVKPLWAAISGFVDDIPG
jgi:predicted PurR-regulated permease PerM